MYGGFDARFSNPAPTPLALRTASPIANPPRALSPRESPKEHPASYLGSPRSPLRNTFSPSNGNDHTSRGPILSSVHPNVSAPASTVRTQRTSSFEAGDDAYLGASKGSEPRKEENRGYMREEGTSLPIKKSSPSRHTHTTESPVAIQEPQSAVLSWDDSHSQDPREDASNIRDAHTRNMSGESLENISEDVPVGQPLQYHHHLVEPNASVRLVGSRPPRPEFRSTVSDPSRTLSPPNITRPESSHLLCTCLQARTPFLPAQRLPEWKY